MPMITSLRPREQPKETNRREPPVTADARTAGGSHSAQAATRPWRWRIWHSPLPLLVLMLAALALRLYRLGSGLWLDEILTYVDYARMPFAQIVTTYESQNQHFLYSLLAHASFVVFGESNWALRLPSALFGVASVGALYLFGRQVTSRTEAFLASALLTVSYHHIWFSQNARGYMGMLFWALLSSWLLLDAFSQERPWLWVAFAASVALGIYTNTAMIFVVCGQFALYLAVLRRRSHPADRATVAGPREGQPLIAAGLYLGFGLAGLLTLTLFAPVLPQVWRSVEGEVSTVPAWTSPLWALSELIKGLQPRVAGGQGLVVGALAVGACAVVSAGVLDYGREARRGGNSPAPLYLLGIPVALCAAVVVGLGHHLWPRLFFFAIGFGALVVMRGCLVVGRAVAGWLRSSLGGRAPLGIALALGVIAVSLLSIPPVYLPKQDYPSTLRYVEARREPGDAAVVVGLATFPLNELYGAEWPEIRTVADLEAIREAARRVWLVYSFPPEVQAVYPEIMAVIERDFTAVKQFPGTVGSGTLYVCRAEAPSARPVTAP